MADQRFIEPVALVNRDFHLEAPAPALVEKAKEILSRYLKKHSKTH